MLKKLTFYVFVFYCFEVGVFLIVAPWLLPQVWENNYFLFVFPRLKGLFLSGYFRGAVTGLGVVNLLVAVSEIIGNERSRHILERSTEVKSKL